MKLDVLLKQGLITKDEYKKVKKNYKNYINRLNLVNMLKLCYNYNEIKFTTQPIRRDTINGCC